MANATYNAKIQSSTRPFAGQFGHRENNLICANFTAITMDTSLTLKPNDGVTHVVCDTTAGSLTLTVPAPAQCKGRVIHTRKSVAGNTFNIVAADGATVGPTANTAIGGVLIFSTGTSWIQV